RSSGFAATATRTSPCPVACDMYATMPAIAPRPIMITLAAESAMRDWILMARRCARFLDWRVRLRAPSGVLRELVRAADAEVGGGHLALGAQGGGGSLEHHRAVVDDVDAVGELQRHL